MTGSRDRPAQPPDRPPDHSSAPAPAPEGDAIVALADEATRRTEDGDIDGGLALANHAVRLAVVDGRPQARAAAQRALGRALYAAGDYRGARDAGEAAFALDLGIDADGPGVGEDENLIGVSVLMEGDPATAVATLRSAATRLETTHGPGHEKTIQALSNLGGALAQAGEPESGEATGREALARAERSLGIHRQTAVVLNSLSVRAGRDPDRSAEALELSERALEVARASVGPHHPLAASLAANVAIHRARIGDPAAAGLLREALAAHEVAFGPDHPNLAFVLIAISDLGADPDEARRSIARAALIRLRTLGPAAKPTLLALRKALDRFGPQTPGEPVAREAIDIYRGLAALQPDANASSQLLRRRSPAEAAAQLERTLERIVGDVPLTDEIRTAVAADYAAADAAVAAGDYASSMDAIERALGRIGAAKGHDSPDLIEPLRRLDAMCQAAGQETRLLEIRGRIADVAEAAYGPDHPIAVMGITQFAERERYEYGALSEETSTRASRAVRAAYDRPVIDRVATRLYESPPQRPARAVPLSVARAEALPAVRAIGPLTGLDAVRWDLVSHAYGPARDTPDEIRLLRATDPDVRSDALDRLANTICHQGSVYPASAAAVPFLARLALDPSQEDRPAIVWLLALLVDGAHDPTTDPVVAKAILAAISPYAASLLVPEASPASAASAASVAALARALRRGRA